MTDVFVRFNNIETEDDLFQFGQNGAEHTFLDIDETDTNIGVPGRDTEYVRVQFMLSADQSMHYRNVYDFIQMLGDIGGLYGLVFSILQTVMAPLVEHAFQIKAI
jgi:hypothetical protein